MIAGESFEISQLNAKKVATISRMVGKMIISGRTTLKELKAVTDTNLVVGILASLQEEDLIELSAVIVGCDKEFARENFNLVWVSEALAAQSENADIKKIIENFTQLVSQIQ
jgi:hypothetical protein